jgi:hypothetical protein
MIRTVGMIAMTNRRRGRPSLHDQNKLEFFVFLRRLKHVLTLAKGREPTDTEMFDLVAAGGGYEHWVAGDWEKIQKAQRDPKVSPQVARMRWGTNCVRAKTTTYPKTLRNYSAICDEEAESDPTFLPFAEMILAGYGIGATQPKEDTRGHCSGWMPTHRL